MKLGWNLKMGMNRCLLSWKSIDGPSTGDLTYGIELNEYPETVMRKGSKEHYQARPWNGLRYSGASEQKTNIIFSFLHVPPAECYTWNALSHNWQLFLSVPRDYCDSYGLCGAYSDCDINESPVFQCLKGFKSKSPTDWNLWIGSGDVYTKHLWIARREKDL
uniref:S-locus glycoprotein domain-containing protein n=1 Tax=Nelumbo nucifera TaxID=4432 RepID=A0A822Y8A3_NELNU|nr:TPA_asm: hypothetical protein HUJ06_031752 [Nelumbo nucifera]